MNLSTPRIGLLAALLAVSLLAGGCAGDDIAADSAEASEPAAALDGELPPVNAEFTWPESEPPDGHYPVTVSSCGEPVTFDEAPRRAVVNDDNMVELMFALGLSDNMAAYAATGPRLRLAAFEQDYAGVDDLGDDYFSLEPTLGADPDFVFSGWNYGFSEDDVNPEVLAELGIPSYVLGESCRRVDDTLAPATVQEWYGDVRAIGDIFGVPERAEALIAHWDERLGQVAERLPADADAEPAPVLSYGWGDEAAGTAPGLTIVPELYRLAGGYNVFEDLPEMWGTVSWEQVVDRAPEVIVITDYGSAAGGQTGAEKQAFLEGLPALADVPAVRNARFLILPQEAVNPGIRNVDGVEALAAELYPEAFADLVDTPGFGLAPTSE